MAATYICPKCPRRFRKMATAKAHFRTVHDPHRGGRKLTVQDMR